MFKKLINSFNKLKLLEKIFIILLILLVLFCIGNNSDNFIFENFSNDNKKYTKKRDGESYDKFYSELYDNIHLNDSRNKYEIGKIKELDTKNKFTKLLDVGCGTGYNVNLLSKDNFDVIGLDKSEHMISKAKENYPESNFITGDILNNNELEHDKFSHITCLGRTIYEIKNKSRFFENCHSLLTSDGYLIVNLANRDKFLPFVQNTESNDILFNPLKYGKNIDRLIIKFDDNNELISKYDKLPHDKDIDTLNNMAEPYGMYIEKFQNFKTNKVRENQINYYMPNLNKIIKLAKSKGFKVSKFIEMDKINYPDEYLYVFKKE